MDESLKALLLLNSAGAGNAAGWRRFLRSRPPAALWQEHYEQIRDLGISEAAHNKIMANFKAAWAEREYESCLNKGIRVITCAEANYPQALNDLSDPPLLLYWHGAAETLPPGGVSVIGTRKATAYGRKIAKIIGEMCAEKGLGVISGGASGIDGAAHAGACERGGTTCAVFGTGVDRYYPSSHAALFDSIRQRGALISEYPLGANGEPWRFPRRNRIVAALSSRLIVVEAPKKSGAMITARLALELGREVWAVPGRIDEEISGGSNRLIYDGAFPFVDMETFFSVERGQASLFGAPEAAAPAPRPEKLTESELLIMDELRRQGEKTVDNISLAVKMSAADVMRIVAILSAKGLIYSSGPGRFSAKI